MSQKHSGNNFPKLHNAMWPGLVGKGSPGGEPCIELDTMLDLTAAAEVDGIKFDGVDLFLFDPHTSIDIDDDGIKKLAEKIQARGFVVGSVVAPVWPPTGGGAAMGSEEDRKKFVGQVRKACRIAKKLRELGARPYGIVRIDSASGVGDWATDPEGNQARIAETFREACEVAEGFGERLAAEGEICWGGMHSYRKMVDLLERVNRPKTLGFQADMAHTLLYSLGYNAPEDAILPANWDWSDADRLDQAIMTLTEELRPWTIDFHVAQNDATVKGSGSHDKTGRHCLPNDPNGKLTITRHAGHWLRGKDGQLTRAFPHICWDGCMFPNAVMEQPQTWNAILKTMIDVRDAHGWREGAASTNAAPRKLVIETEPAGTPIKINRAPEPKPKVKAKAKPVAKAKKAAAKPAKKKAARPAPKKAKRKVAKKPSRKPARKPAKKAVRRPARKGRRK